MSRPGEVRRGGGGGGGAAERLEPLVSTPVLSMGWPGRPEELCTIDLLRETGWLPTLRTEYIDPASWSPLSSGLLAQDNTKFLGGPVLRLWTLLWVPGVPGLVEAGVSLKHRHSPGVASGLA